MNKSALTVQECFAQMQVLREKAGEMADRLKAENRERNEAEQIEYNNIQSEMQQLQLRALQATSAYKEEISDPMAEAEKVLRENLRDGKRTEFKVMRDIMLVSDVTSGGIVPLNVKDILEPLEEGFILDKVGLPLLSGLKGDYVWPVYEMVDATICGEGEELGDTAIEFSQLTASFDRIGIAIPVSRESLNQTDGVLETIVRKIMPKALQRLLNKALFTPITKLDSATNIVGPFVTGNYATEATLSETPTAQELNSMKAALLETGIEGDKLCWVMTKSIKAILEVTPINTEGIYVPMIQNDTLLGLPVYTTSYISGYIGLGDFTYEPMGLFGEINFIVDPYTKSRNNAIDFVLNADYGCKTLRPEAFALGTIGSSSAE